MNIDSARKVAEFVHILARDGEGRPTRFLVPGHRNRRYEVSLERNGGLSAYCWRVDDFDEASGMLLTHDCQGNQHGVCYHVLASCIVAAEAQGKELSWCESQQGAERLSNIKGQVFTVKSAQSGKVAYGVVKSSNEDEPELAPGTSKHYMEQWEHQHGEDAKWPITDRKSRPAGLDKSTLVELAVNVIGDKEQWYSGESFWLAEDAFLKNDDGFVRLYRVDKSQRYPKPERLAIVFWLDPSNVEAGWQRYTSEQAMKELFEP